MPQRIAYLTDLHLDDQYSKMSNADTFRHLETVLKDLETKQVDKLILGGDLGEPATMAYLFEQINAFEEVHITLGNHDEWADILPYYNKAQQLEAQAALYYSFVEDGYKYIFLDSSSGLVPSNQVAWLQQELDSSYPILLFMHHPVFGIAERCLVDEQFPLQERELMQQLLLESGANITLFCGHYHIPHQQTQGKVQQIITPAISFQFDMEAEQLRFHANHFGYRMIEVSETGVQSEVFSFSL
jgi:Icc protein